MTAIPIMAGVVVKDGAFAASYPVNLEPRAVDNGMSKGELCTTRGAVTHAEGPGIGRGGYEWRGQHYRVMGKHLVRVAGGTITPLGEVGNDLRRVRFGSDFSRLSISSAGRLYYYDGTALTDVTDPDLGDVRDHVWMDGYFVTTDGSSIVVTNLTDATQVNPERYGSAESDPDPIIGLEKFNGELYAVGRYTIEVFSNVGGTVFPFQRQNGATLPVGAVCATAKCVVGGETLAFVGGAREDRLGVYVLANGGAQRISSREIDDLIAADPHPELIEMECRSFARDHHLIIHLAQCSIGFPIQTSSEAGQAAWFILNSGEFGPYRLRNATLVGGRHFVDDLASPALGVLSDGVPEHFGEVSDWRFDNATMYASGRGFIVHEVELFGQFPAVPSPIFFSITRDGVAWSREVARRLTGRRDERVVWRPGVQIPAYASFRFRGRGRVAVAICNVEGEALAA